MAHVRAREWIGEALRDYRACDGRPGIADPHVSAIQAHAIDIIGGQVAWGEKQAIEEMKRKGGSGGV
jgi:hypothetical protein